MSEFQSYRPREESAATALANEGDTERILAECMPIGDPWKACCRLATVMLDAGLSKDQRADLIEAWVDLYSKPDAENDRPALLETSNADLIIADIEAYIAKVESGEHVNKFSSLLERAQSADDDDVTGSFRHPSTRTLARLCRIMAEQSDDGTFYLSVRQAAKAIGSRHAYDGTRAINALSNAGVISLVGEADTKKRKAAIYQYIGHCSQEGEL